MDVGTGLGKAFATAMYLLFLGGAVFGALALMIVYFVVRLLS